MAEGTGGVKPMNLGTRLVRERERLVGMTDKERAYRRQFLLDQRLAPHEPVFVPEYHRIITNPIRRAIRMPLDALFVPLNPILGKKAALVRFLTGKFAMFVTAVYAGHYYFKYNSNDWTRKGGWRVITSRAAVLPGEPSYPERPAKSLPTHYADREFSKSPI